MYVDNQSVDYYVYNIRNCLYGASAMIEILMTIALFLYFAAFFIARKSKQYRMAHIPVALLGFIFDMYGTFMMFMLDNESQSWALQIHTGLTLVAISLFFVQGYLGITRQRRKHIFFAKTIFLPTWVISFLSGGLFYFV